MWSNRHSIWATVGIGVVMFVLALVPHVAAGGPVERTTYLSFSRSVRLPGVTLSPGTYVFELLDPFGASGVVRVRSGDRRTSYFMGITNATERPRGPRLGESVTLGESAAGTAPPITAWWPIGELTGREFIYPDR
jgi:hypothetical protein